MQTFQCVCGQRVFFENSQCLACGRMLGWCPCCQTLSALEQRGERDIFICAQSGCGARLRLCFNYATYSVCNRCVSADADPPAGTTHQPLCDMCCFNETIPDLSVVGNEERWRRLEVAKRRVLRQFQVLGLPPFDGADKGPPLAFDFLADAVPTQTGWWRMGNEKVFTGHANGKITINLREADSVEREKLRVAFGESHRTLIGHFRHELAHYLWDALIAGSRDADFAAAFGDPNNPTYAAALNAHYQHGPPANWADRYISAYAAMHPLEDWAETTAAFFEVHSILDTAEHYGFIAPNVMSLDIDAMVDQFTGLGIFLNEVNRAIGLPDVVPDVVTRPVRKKMAFVHRVLLG